MIKDKIFIQEVLRLGIVPDNSELGLALLEYDEICLYGIEMLYRLKEYNKVIRFLLEKDQVIRLN